MDTTHVPTIDLNLMLTKANLLLALTATGPDKAGKLIHRWLACTLPVCVSMGGPEHPWVPVRNDDSICAMIGRAHIMS